MFFLENYYEMEALHVNRLIQPPTM